MRSWIKGATCGVALSLILGSATFARDVAAPKKEGAACGEYGTSFYFEDSPADAAKSARKDGKLVMVIHVSGHFEDPGLT